MKILHLDFDDLKNPHAGGQARITYEISRRLAKKHEITIVTGNYPGAKNEVIDGIRYIRTGIGYFPWNFLSFIMNAPELAKKLPHDVLIESFTPPVSVSFTPRFTEKPVVAMVHWLFAKEMSQKYKLPFFLWEILGLRFYKNFIVYNEDYKARILKYSPRANILINSYPVDGPAKDLGFYEEDYMLFLGRMDIHQKGLDLLIKSFDSIAEKFPTKLVIAGGGRSQGKVLRMIDKMKNRHKVEYVGKYDTAKREKLLRGCKFVCLSSRYEMAPLVAEEAMSYSKPLVVFDIDGVKSTVARNCALFAKPYSIENYADSLLRLLKDNTLRKNMGLRARKRYEEFITWDESARLQEDFCNRIVGARQRN